MAKKSLSTKVDPDFADRFEEAARDKGIKKSEALRRAAKEWMDENQGENGPWSHIPESMNSDIKKVFEAIRDYQHMKKEHPLSFRLGVKKHRYRESVGVPDLEEVLGVKWSSKIDSHKKKVKKAFALELLEVDFSGNGGDAIMLEGEIKLSDLGKKLMKSLDGGNYDPREIRKLEELKIEPEGGNGGEATKRQQKLVVQN